ncbi:MAG: GtrA family protein [bacterium]|nr:GtrA family protein [bacterium]
MNFWNKIEQLNIIQKNPSIIEFLKFAVVGVIGTIVDFSFYALLTRVFGVYYITATCISVFLAIINNFFLNKYWTFNKGQSGKAKTEYIKFFVVSIVNYFLNVGITWYIVEKTTSEAVFGSSEDFFAKVIAIGIVLFSNYFGNKYWTFKD